MKGSVDQGNFMRLLILRIHLRRLTFSSNGAIWWGNRSINILEQLVSLKDRRNLEVPKNMLDKSR
ncbi:unnamed protein product [Citrullus colocynthis]|uniref:Uncharacterized protein n=1 Tax=Citrullus colocynthis TaxID=252529 RepID=A0ABP0XXF2_9ROSI